ncbi:MAG: glutathione S-transferase [Rhodobacteraceae bacterium]|nr:MAG: glutathione S-transferase [Paracoccaceae bacterium]|tara:strand:+ start:319 stop:957 length:639 start_codon:yes stop_codon:yes gene_type:complete
MTEQFKLYCFAQSGNAYKAALFLALADLDWNPIFVDFFNGETRSEEFKKINSMGEVPVLVDQDKNISQSGAILHYLSLKTELFTSNKSDIKLEINRWLLWDNYKLTPNLATGRFMSLFLPEAKRNQSVIDFLLGRASASLKILNTHLVDRDFVVGDNVSIADLSIAGYIFFTEEFDFDMSPFPNVISWRNRIRKLKNWQHPYDLMPGHPIKR